MTPAALSLITTTYSGAQRAKALTLWGAVGGLGIAAGVLVGGALTTWRDGSRSSGSNVPVGVTALAVRHQGPAPAHHDGGPTRRVRPRRSRDCRRRTGGVDVRLAGAPATAGPRPALSRGSSSRPCCWAGSPWSNAELRSHSSTRNVVVAVTGLRHGRHAGRHRSLVAAVFLASIFVQTVLGYSALQAGLAFPAARPRADPRHPCRRPSGAHATARTVAVTGLVVASAGAVLLSRVSAATPTRRRAAGPARRRVRRRHGVRRGLRLGDDRDPCPALRDGLGLPDDRARGRGRRWASPCSPPSPPRPER
jgi:MFS family permease